MGDIFRPILFTVVLLVSIVLASLIGIGLVKLGAKWLCSLRPDLTEDQAVQTITDSIHHTGALL